MMKKTCLLLAALVMLLAWTGAQAKIVATPESVTLGNTTLGFVSVDCDGQTVTLVLSGFDGRMRIKNDQLILSYQASIVVDGKTVKCKTGGVDSGNYVFTYKAKKLPESILVFHPKDDLTGPYSEAVITLTDDEYAPVSNKTEYAGYTVSMTTLNELFNNKGNLSNAFNNLNLDSNIMLSLNLGSGIMLKGSNVPKSFFQNSKQGQSMLLVPVTLKAIKGQQQAEKLIEALSTTTMSDGTKLYDIWYNEQEYCFVFDTKAYEGKELGVTVIDGALCFGYMK